MMATIKNVPADRIIHFTIIHYPLPRTTLKPL